MTPSQQLARARNCVKLCFQEQAGSQEGVTPEFRESIFVCEGFYRGRRFRNERISAVWFAEEDELKVHAADGNCVASLNAAQMAEMVAAQGEASVETTDVLPMRIGQEVAAEVPNESQPVRRAA